MKVAFHTLGCKVNQYETESMMELFQARDYEIVEEDADIYVINTCTVTNMSASKSRQFIRRAKRDNEDSIIAVVGCYSQVSPEEIEAIEGVDIILGTTERSKIVDLCEEVVGSSGFINKVEDLKGFKEFEEIHVTNMDSMTRAYIKIQDGCNRYCSYCIIPYARGPIRSRDLDNILKEVRKLRDLNFKEIVLTGIHVASYGKDLEDISLIDVIREIAKIEGIERIRLSSVEPSIITRDFMKEALKTKKLCDHFHLSLQSGSDSVLKRMNRKYDSKFYRERVDIIREFMPDAGITTDIIAGFPGESEEEFQETLDFVKRIGFSRIHVFKYSPREGTPAAARKDQIDGNIKTERSNKLMDLEREMAAEFREKLLGKNLEVLYEEKIDSYYEGYTSNYMRVRTESKDNLEGKVLDTRIVAQEDGKLIGELEEV